MSIMSTLERNLWSLAKSKVKFGFTFNKDTKITARNLSGEKGIYFFVEAGAKVEKGSVVYIGETYAKTTGILSRVRNHQRSLRDPVWRTEKTGSKFVTRGKDTGMMMDMYYITADDLGVTSKKKSIALESMLISYLKPQVFDTYKKN